MKVDQVITPEFFTGMQDCYLRLCSDFVEYTLEEDSAIDISDFDSYEDFLADLRGELNPSILGEDYSGRKMETGFLRGDLEFLREFYERNLSSIAVLKSEMEDRVCDWVEGRGLDLSEVETFLPFEYLPETVTYLFAAAEPGSDGTLRQFQFALESMLNKVCGQYRDGKEMTFTTRDTYQWLMDARNFDNYGELEDPVISRTWYYKELA